MAKKKSNKTNLKKSNKSFGSKHLVLIVVAVIIIGLIFVFSLDKDSDYAGNGDNTISLSEFSESCLSYAQGSFRAEFCNYMLVSGDLVNCRDSRVLDYLSSNGVDINLPVLNCRNVDNYSFRKTACELYSNGNDDMVIADSTCAYYK